MMRSRTEDTPIFDALLDEFWPVVQVITNPDGTISLDPVHDWEVHGG